MAYNGSGVFNRLYSWITDAANNEDISATKFDAEMDGFADGLSNCITRDGQSTVIADIPFGGKKITGLGTPVSATDAATKGYVDSVGALASGTAASAVSIDIEDYFSTDDSLYRLRLWNCGPTVNGAEIMIRLKVGVYQSSNYAWVTLHTSSSSSATIPLNAVNSTTVATDGLYIATNATNGTNDRGTWEILITEPARTGNVKRIDWSGGYGQSAGAASLLGIGTGAYHGSTAAITGVRIMANTGLISASWALEVVQ